jgi:hypothetical protein
MPEWMRPSGVFGIGLQSVFLLTDHLVVTTRHHEEAGVLRIELRNGQGPASSGLAIKRHEGRDVVQTPFGTKIEFETSKHTSSARADISVFGESVARPTASEHIGALVGKFAQTCVCSIELNGTPCRQRSDEDSRSGRYYFDRDTGLVFSHIRTTLSTEEVSVGYRGAPLERSSFWWEMLGFRCDVYFGRANELLHLNREGFTEEGRSAVNHRIDAAISRMIPYYIGHLRASLAKERSADLANELQACSLYMHLRDYDRRIVGDEWKSIGIAGDGGEVTLGELLSRPHVTLEEGAWRGSERRTAGLYLMSSRDSVLFRVDGQAEWGCIHRLLRKHYPNVVFDGYLRSNVLGDARGTRLRFTRDTATSRVTERGLRDLLLDLETIKDGRARGLDWKGLSIPCPNRFASLCHKPDVRIRDVKDAEPGWLQPRMVCPFGYGRDGRVVLDGLGRLVEWTAENAEPDSRSLRDVAQAMWDFIVEADRLMSDVWQNARKKVKAWMVPGKSCPTGCLSCWRLLAVRPNEIAFSRRRSGARGASGAETGAKTLVERTRPGGRGR